MAFLDKLAQLRSMQPLHSSTTRKMADLYGLDASKNAEIKAVWYRLCINAGNALGLVTRKQALVSKCANMSSLNVKLVLHFDLYTECCNSFTQFSPEWSYMQGTAQPYLWPLPSSRSKAA